MQIHQHREHVIDVTAALELLVVAAEHLLGELEHAREVRLRQAQQGEDHRQLEADAEGEDQRHDQRQIFRDAGQQFDLRLAGLIRLLHPDEEMQQIGHHQIIDDQCAEQKKHRRRDQIGLKGGALKPSSMLAGGRVLGDLDPGADRVPIVLIHGGPQGAWLDNWGGRWSFQLFASIGAAVVVVQAINWVDGISSN